MKKKIRDMGGRKKGKEDKMSLILVNFTVAYRRGLGGWR